jgi:hypothetical protein
MINERFSTSNSQPVRVAITINKETWSRAHEVGGSIVIALAPDNPIRQMLADMIYDGNCVRPRILICAPAGEGQQDQEKRGSNISNKRVEHWLEHYNSYEFTEHHEEAFIKTSVHVLKKDVTTRV